MEAEIDLGMNVGGVLLSAFGAFSVLNFSQFFHLLILSKEGGFLLTWNSDSLIVSIVAIEHDPDALTFFSGFSFSHIPHE